MELEIEETGPVERKLKVEVATADVDAAFDAVYRELRQRASIPGFRKGKVPRSVMQRYFGERARGDVLERLIQDTLPRALEEAELAVVGEPQLNPGESPREGSPFSYEATLDIRPEIELRRVRGLEIAPPVLPVPEEDPVDRHLEGLRVQHGQMVEAEAGAPAARGHVAVVDYAGTVEGRPFEGSSGKEVLVELGEGHALPGIEDGIVGMTVGSERDVEVELPDDYPSADVAGRPASFHVKLVELKRRELAELDDEFAKDVSEFDTLEELRADLSGRVETARSEELDRLKRSALLDALIEANPFPVPGGLVDRDVTQRMARAARSLPDLSDEQLAELVKRWREELRPVAERDVRLAFLLPQIAEAEGIEISDEDVDAELRSIAEREQQPLGALKRRLREQGLLDGLRRRLLESRVVDFLVSQATLSGT